MPLLRPRWLLAPVSFLAAAPLAAQLPPLTVPKNYFRLELSGRFDNWDRMYFDGIKRDAGGDFIRDPVDSSWLPGLGDIEARLRALTGAPGLRLSLGRTRSNLLVNVGTEYFGAAFGLTSRLTLFATVPLVRVRVQPVLRVDSTQATAGFNPAHPVFGTGGGIGFLSELQSAQLTLDSRIRSGFYDANPATLALAQAVLARVQELSTVLSEATFLPVAGSAPGLTLTSSIDSIRAQLSDSLGIPGLTATPGLPDAGIPDGGLERFAINPEGPIQAFPFEPPILRHIGDIELGAAFAWLDHRPAGTSLTVRSVLQGTVRLATGKLDQPESLFDLSAGDRQPDVQADLVTDFGAGRFGARVTARYVVQLPVTLMRRLAPPDQPFAPASSLASVERDPGEIVEGILEPWFRIARHFAITGGVRHWRKPADRYAYAAGQAPILDTSPDVLAIGSRENGTALSAGLSFVHDGVRADGRRGAPLDATLRGELVVGSTEGRVPVKQSISLTLRLYPKLF